MKVSAGSTVNILLVARLFLAVTILVNSGLDVRTAIAGTIVDYPLDGSATGVFFSDINQNFQTATGFSLSEDVDVQEVAWYGGYVNTPADPAGPIAFKIRLYAQGGALPNTNFFYEAPVAATGVFTGVTLTIANGATQVPIYRYQVPVTPVMLPAGTTAWVSVVEDTDDRVWVWAESSTFGPGNARRFVENTAWTSNGSRAAAASLYGTFCGDGALKPGEECDDGNTSNADGCAANCTIENGWTCNGQPSVCVVIPTDTPTAIPTSTATTTPTETVTLTPTETPTSPDTPTGSPTASPTATPTHTPTAAPIGACPLSVDSGCTTGFEKGTLLIKEDIAGSEKLVTKMVKGPALEQTALGNPLSTGGTAYSLCIYDDAGTLAAGVNSTIVVDRAGADCSGHPCWKPIGGNPPDGKGYKYKDSAMAANGVLKLLYKGGAIGKSRVVVKGKGPNLPDGIPAALQATTFTTVQLRSSDGICHSVTVDDIEKQQASFFRAKFAAP